MSKLAMEALLDGKIVKTENLGRIKLDNNGVIHRLDVSGYSLYYPFVKFEIEEPEELKIGPKHVGRRVRLRNGDTALICSFCSDCEETSVRTFEYCYKPNGRIRIDNSDHQNDIVEILND